MRSCNQGAIASRGPVCYTINGSGGDMGSREEMADKFRKLIEEGNVFREDFLNGYRYRWYRFSSLNADYARWKQDVAALIRSAFGEQSRYCTELASVESELAPKAPGSVFSFYLNTLKKAQFDFQDAAAEARASCASDLMGDFLQRAEGMAAKGHYISAATLAGAVLEDILRRLCEVHEVFCPENATLEVINDKLLAAGVYDAALHRETAVRISLRKTAELCYAEKITDSNVREMIAWLRAFIQRHFTRSGLPAGVRR